MSTHLLVKKRMQEWAEKRTLMSQNANASRCDKQSTFPDFTNVFVILPIVSSIDFTNMKII